MSRIVPLQKLPGNMFTALDAKPWPLDQVNKPNFYLIVSYRGVQCSFCKTQIMELEQKLSLFIDRNVEVIAVSADNQERAQKAVEDWSLAKLRLGFDLSFDAAKTLGLYISSATKEVEMPRFTEPGIFLIAPNQTLFASWISSFPFARPPLDEIIRCIDFVIEHKRGPRGTLNF